MFKKISNRTYLLEASKLGGMFLFVFLSIISWVINPKVDKDVKDVLSSNFIHFVVGYFILTLLFSLLNFQNKQNAKSKKAIALLIIPSLYILAYFWAILTDYLDSIFHSESFSFNSNHFVTGFFYLFLIIIFTGLYYLVNHWVNLKKQKELTLQATNLANEAQLQMLRYQINPHFLFNALNTIRSMVEEDKTIARDMITELSNFFRYSLSQNGTTDTLENEINAIKNYLEIQKIRFEEKLQIIYDIDENLYQLKIPFFIIIPLVENAIKFGLESSKMPLNIKISAKANSHLEISVHNTGSLVEDSKSIDGTKTGIENTKKRLSLYFPDNHTFKLYEQDSWVIAQIIIKDFRNLIAE